MYVKHSMLEDYGGWSPCVTSFVILQYYGLPMVEKRIKFILLINSNFKNTELPLAGRITGVHTYWYAFVSSFRTYPVCLWSPLLVLLEYLTVFKSMISMNFFYIIFFFEN